MVNVQLPFRAGVLHGIFHVAQRLFDQFRVGAVELVDGLLEGLVGFGAVEGALPVGRQVVVLSVSRQEMSHQQAEGAGYSALVNSFFLA